MESEQITPEAEAQMRSEVAAEVFDGKAPEVAVEEAPEEKPAEETPAVEPKEEDPWDGLSPKLREMFESMESKVQTYDSMANRLKQAERRVGAMTNKISGLETELAEAKKAKKEVAKSEAPTQKEIDKASKDPEAWAELKEEWPVWADAMDARLKPVEGLSEQMKEIRNEIAELRGVKKEKETKKEDTQDTEAEIAALTEKLSLTKAHPDWEETCAKPEFAAWIQNQPAELKRLYESSPYASDAIHVLNQFKKAKPAKTAEQIAAEREQRLKTSQTPSGKPGKKVAAKTDAEKTEAEIRREEAAKLWPD